MSKIVRWRTYKLNQNQKKIKIILEEKTKEIIEEKNRVENLYQYQSTLLSEVHHRIKNNLQLIISLLTLQKTKSSNKSESEMIEMLHHRVSSISLIHEQLYNTKEFDKIYVESYVKDLLKNFLLLVSEKNIQIEYQVNKLELNLETITPLGLIWSELISNSIKYNENKADLRIFFDLIKDDDQYEMHYYDNGVGYTNGHFTSNQKGMGYIIIHSLSRQLAAEIQSYNDKGAHYIIKFKEKIISPL